MDLTIEAMGTNPWYRLEYRLEYGLAYRYLAIRFFTPTATNCLVACMELPHFSKVPTAQFGGPWVLSRVFHFGDALPLFYFVAPGDGRRLSCWIYLQLVMPGFLLVVVYPVRYFEQRSHLDSNNMPLLCKRRAFGSRNLESVEVLLARTKISVGNIRPLLLHA